MTYRLCRCAPDHSIAVETRPWAFSRPYCGVVRQVSTHDSVRSIWCTLLPINTLEFSKLREKERFLGRFLLLRVVLFFFFFFFCIFYFYRSCNRKESDYKIEEKVLVMETLYERFFSLSLFASFLTLYIFS